MHQTLAVQIDMKATRQAQNECIRYKMARLAKILGSALGFASDDGTKRTNLETTRPPDSGCDEMLRAMSSAIRMRASR